MRSQLFKRAKACTCEGDTCDCSVEMNREAAKSALATVEKLAKFLEDSDAKFEHVRWASEARRDLQGFLRRNTDLVTASVSNTITSVKEFHARLAAQDFNYESMVDETSPNAMFDAPEEIFADLKDDKDVTKALGNDEVPTAKTAGSALMGGGGGASSTGSGGYWDDVPTDALTKVVKALSGALEDKAVQTIVAELTAILADRAPEPEEGLAPEGEPKVSKHMRGLRVAATDPIEAKMDPTTPQGNLKGDSLDDTMKSANNGSPVDSIQELEVLEGDKSVTANNGSPVDAIQELEVLEGDKTVTAKRQSSRLSGLRIANIE